MANCAIVLDQLDRRERRHALRRVDVIAHRIGVAELRLDRLRFLAEQEVDELLARPPDWHRP